MRLNRYSQTAVRGDFMEKYTNIVYKEVREPASDCTGVPVMLTDETMQERYDSVYV